MHANEPLGLDPPETRLCFYARSLLKSSVVQAVLVANLRSPTSKDVVFVKENTLELLACAGESEPVSICELSLFGCVKCCQRVSHNASFPFVETAHPPLAGCDLLVILSSSGKLSFVGVKQNRFELIAEHQISRPGFDACHLGKYLAVEEHSRAVGVCALEHVLSIFPRSTSTVSFLERSTAAQFTTGINHAFDGFAWAFRFCRPRDSTLPHMRVAMVVQERGAVSQVLRILECSISEKAIHQVAAVQILPPPSGLPTTPAAVLELIPLPTPSFGFLIVQEGSIGFYDPSVHQEHDVDDELIVTVATLNTVHPCGQSGLITAHTFDYNEAGEPRLVLISEDGYLWWSSDLPAYLACPIRELQLACSHVPGLVSSMCIESLGNGTLIVPAQMGDGLILKVDFAEAKLDPKVSLPGLSSVVDFVTADLFGEQQSQLFACSASTPSSGFVRCVRNGIGVTELMKSDPTFQGVNGLFTLRANPTDSHHAYLVISFVANTRVMSVSDELRDISHLSGFSTDSSTIYCGESVAGFLVQFCEHLIKAVRPVANESSVPQSALWRPPTGASICAGSTKSHVVVAASSAAEIFVLTVSSTSEQLAPSFMLMCSHKLSYAICCIEVVLEPAAPADVMDGARLQNSVAVIAGTYEPALDVLVAAPGAMHVVQHLGLAEHSHTDSSKPHAVKFAELDGVPCVLVGLRNGYLLCFEYRICPSLASVMRLQPSPTVRRIGRHPTQLAALDSKGIMALSDHLCLVQHERHRLTFAPICLASAGHCTAFACDSCPRGILASMNDSLSILSIDQERPLNVQSIPVADGSPRRLLYHAASQALLVACYSATSSDLRVLHTKLRTMHTVFQAEPNEYIYSLSDWAAADESWVLVGTMRKQAETDEPLRTYETSGRLLVFKLPLCMDSSVASAACVQLLGDVSLNGAVLCIQPFTDRLVMASASDRLLMISVRRRRTIDRITLKIVAQTSVRHRIVSLSIANRAQASPAVPSTVLIAVGDDGDSVWYLTYSHTPTRHFTKVYPRLVLCNAQLWLAAAQPGASERASERDESMA